MCNLIETQSLKNSDGLNLNHLKGRTVPTVMSKNK